MESTHLEDSAQPETQPQPHHRRRVARAVAGAAGALVLIIGSGAAGIAIGHAQTGGSTAVRQPTSLGTTSPATGTYGYGYRYGGGSPFGQDSGGGSSSTFGTQDSQVSSSSTATSAQIAGLVRIQTTLGYEDGEGAGTGMILDGSGEVLTNHHVVAGATAITATVMSTGKTYTATVVGTDAEADVAVIQLEGASGLSTVKTDATLPSIGDDVTAVGDANGSTDHLTAASGTVSALDRTITTSAENGETSETLHGLIEFAAGVVGGDSGGAVYDGDGEVVGMTTAASTSRAIGYAVPIGTALTIAADLENHVGNSAYTYGRAAFLGAGLATSGGAATTTIGQVYSGTPAAKAGLVAGDRVTRVGSTRVSTGAQLQKAIAIHAPGDSITIAYTSADGGSHTTAVTLTEGPIS